VVQTTVAIVSSIVVILINTNAGPRRCYRYGSIWHIARFCNQNQIATDDTARATVATVSVSEAENVQVNTCIAVSSLCTTGPVMTVSSDTHCVLSCKKANDQCVSSCESSKNTLIGNFRNFLRLKPWPLQYVEVARYKLHLCNT